MIMVNIFLLKFGKWFLNFCLVLSLYCLFRVKGRCWIVLVSVYNGVWKIVDDKKLVIWYYLCCWLFMILWIICFCFYQFRIILNVFLLIYNVIEGLVLSGKGRLRGFLQWMSIVFRGSSFVFSFFMFLKLCKLVLEVL